jgi:hypothetical protein
LKIKTDFVTNSSSASFILNIVSIYDEIDIFNSTRNDYLIQYKADDYELCKEIEDRKNVIYAPIMKKIYEIEEKLKKMIDLNNFEKKLYSDYKNEISHFPSIEELKIKNSW